MQKISAQLQNIAVIPFDRVGYHSFAEALWSFKRLYFVFADFVFYCI